ncbi:flagellar biosynthetic protein FliP, partial [bacterium]|nr:flagellar biosynthetic protein FliP [bacterium]
MVKSSFKIIFVCVVVAAGIFLLSDKSYSQIPIPKVTLGIERAEKPEDVAMSIQLLFLMTVLSLAPAILILMTSFTRIIIIFHFVRQALGTQQMPTNQILIGLALFLTLFIMSPVWNNVNENAIQPYL